MKKQLFRCEQKEQRQLLEAKKAWRMRRGPESAGDPSLSRRGKHRAEIFKKLTRVIWTITHEPSFFFFFFTVFLQVIFQISLNRNDLCKLTDAAISRTYRKILPPPLLLKAGHNRNSTIDSFYISKPLCP